MAEGIKLLGRKSSANVQKVMWALEELGLDHEQIELGGQFGGLDTPEYKAMNPNSLVPTLQDGDFVLWESHAIVRYLAAKYGTGSLWPENIRARALADQWTGWTSARFQPAWIGVFVAVVRTSPASRSPETIAKLTADTHACFAIMDAQLAKTPFLAGAVLTYADIVAGVEMYRWTTMQVDRGSFPAVEAWHRRLLERPAFVAAVNIDYSDLVAR
ncbi:MAG TPA: glutathione S-transferase family protein [Devosiaceae bacterium]|nr:glutathione S-transferase family protein [Devosiaceae bacterium]